MTALEQIRALAAQGIGRRNVEATIGREMTDAELVEFRKAQTVRQLRIAAKKARGPMSVAERVAKHVASTNEVGEIAPVKHPRLKESCRNDLERFGWYYCRDVLKHRASADIREGLLAEVQQAILTGGKIGVEYGRGAGKTTWVLTIAATWAVLYGHRRYPVLISATAKLAKKNLKNIKRLISRSAAILADFPEVAVAIRHLGGVSQRAASQTYHGQPTDIEWGGDQITLPMLRDADGRPLGDGCGAVIASIGIGGSVRGANEGGQRPDYLILDDPQNKKIAHSPKLVRDTIEYIESDALQLSGHDRLMSAFITITPQCFGDIASELTSGRHPEWAFKVQPFVKRRCANWTKLVADFCEQYYLGNAAHDHTHAAARDWYLEHRAEFVGTETIDAEQYDHREEVDVVHHMLNLRASLGERAFNAEIMMEVADVSTQLTINSDIVAQALNGAPRLRLPPGTDSLVAFSDVNLAANRGMSWVVLATGKKRTAAVVAYGRYPERGSLIEPNASDAARMRAIGLGIRSVVDIIATLPFRDQQGRKVTPRALGFDRGFMPEAVHRTLAVIKKTLPLPFPVVAVRGVGDNFTIRKDELLRAGDHVAAARGRLGEFLNVVSPYWREIMQSSFMETPLMPGSLSLYGTDAAVHATFANEIAAERLMRKWYDERQRRVRWQWVAVNEENHYGDALTMAFALASYYHCYSALPSVIDAAAMTPHEVHQDDLFNPTANAAIAENTRYDAPVDEVATPPLPLADPRPAVPRLIYPIKRKKHHKYRHA